MEFHAGRLIDHVHLNVANLDRSAKFYTAILEALELPPGNHNAHAFQFDELYISHPGPNQLISHVHLAFQARDEAMVKRFYDAAIAAGGTDNGGPGERSYHPGYCAAFVFDPDGNNIEAVTHGREKRSAPSVIREPV
ncbi:VOC family protein [Devosia sp. CN2-171]|jgi:catechol 2,3-dioxygenase-like lactoylglutathione lyase family enzyme|uniref:VOC family protein n=1 Tax=Devosia sp. CN2-171 TaxID=3400909 RepID=UPI003BF92721